MGQQAVVADRDPEAAEDVHDREDHGVGPREEVVRGRGREQREDRDDRREDGEEVGVAVGAGDVLDASARAGGVEAGLENGASMPHPRPTCKADKRPAAMSPGAPGRRPFSADSSPLVADLCHPSSRRGLGGRERWRRSRQAMSRKGRSERRGAQRSAVHGCSHVPPARSVVAGGGKSWPSRDYSHATTSQLTRGKDAGPSNPTTRSRHATGDLTDTTVGRATQRAPIRAGAGGRRGRHWRPSRRRDANAGTYVVSACGAAPGGVNNSWSPYASHANVTAYGTPCAPISGGLIARAAANGQSAPGNAVAGWTFTRPSAETLITGVDVSAELYRLGGDASNFWGVGVFDDTGSYLWGGGATLVPPRGNGERRLPPDQRQQPHRRSASASGARTAAAARPRAAATRRRTTHERAPRSTAPASRSTTRRIRRTRTSAAGCGPIRAGSADRRTSGSTRPTTSGSSASASQSTATSTRATAPATTRARCRAPDRAASTRRSAPPAFDDGGHALIFRSTDASGNVRTDAKQIFIDNTAPAAPSTPQLAGAPSTTWRTVNGFTLTYSNPSTGNGSENTSSDVQLCAVDDQGTPQMPTCTLIPHGAASGSNTFNVPSPGRFRARVRVTRPPVRGGLVGVGSGAAVRQRRAREGELRRSSTGG